MRAWRESGEKTQDGSVDSEQGIAIGVQRGCVESRNWFPVSSNWRQRSEPQVASCSCSCARGFCPTLREVGTRFLRPGSCAGAVQAGAQGDTRAGDEGVEIREWTVGIAGDGEGDGQEGNERQATAALHCVQEPLARRRTGHQVQARARARGSELQAGVSMFSDVCTLKARGANLQSGGAMYMGGRGGKERGWAMGDG